MQLTKTQKIFSVLTARQWQIAAMIFGSITLMMVTTSCSAAWVTEANTLLTTLTTVFSSVLSILALAGVKVSSAVSATFNADVTEVENEITAVGPLITAYDSTRSTSALQSLTNALDLVKANAANLLSGITQLSAAWQTKIGAIITLGINTVEEIVTLLPKPTATVEDLHAHYHKAVLFFSKSPAQRLKDSYNTIIKTPTGDAEVDAVFAQVKTL